jgi:hypothetical protein
MEILQDTVLKENHNLIPQNPTLASTLRSQWPGTLVDFITVDLTRICNATAFPSQASAIPSTVAQTHPTNRILPHPLEAMPA